MHVRFLYEQNVIADKYYTRTFLNNMFLPLPLHIEIQVIEIHEDREKERNAFFDVPLRPSLGYSRTVYRRDNQTPREEPHGRESRVEVFDAQKFTAGSGEGAKGCVHEWRCVGITCHVILVHIYRGGKHATTRRQADGARGEASEG